jgi:hypothetical protein
VRRRPSRARTAAGGRHGARHGLDPLLDPEPFVALALAEDLRVPPGWWDPGPLREEVARTAVLTGAARIAALARIDREVVGERALLAPYSDHVGPEFVAPAPAA